MVISSFKSCFFFPWLAKWKHSLCSVKSNGVSLVVIKNIEVYVLETSSVLKHFCSETFLTHFSYGTQPKYETRWKCEVKNRGKTPTIFWGFGLFYIWQKALFSSLLSQPHFQLSRRKNISNVFLTIFNSFRLLLLEVWFGFFGVFF